MNAEILKSAVNIPEDGRLYKKLSDKKKSYLEIMFLGGSITEGFDGKGFLELPYPVSVCRYLQEKYAEKEIICRNLASAACSSAIGLIDFIRASEERVPDIVITEFAVNDSFDRYNAINFESMIRRILKSSGEPAVIVINSCKTEGGDCEAYMREIADHYRLPSVSVRTALKALNKLDSYTGDGIHPGIYGHDLIAELIKYALDNTYNGGIFEYPTECCYGNTAEDISFYDYEKLSEVCRAVLGNSCEKKFISKKFPCGIRLSDTGMSFKIPGKIHSGILYIIHIISKDRTAFGKADIIINGKVSAVLDGYSLFGWDNPISFGAALEKGKDCTVEICMHSGDESKHFDIAGFGI